MSEKIYDFKTSNELGKIGEAIAEKYFNQSNKIKSYLDVTKDDIYREKDIDFITYMKNGDVITVEAKADKVISSNIFFETISNKEKNTLGCMLKTEADYIFYYFIAFKELYILKREQYVNWVKKEKLYLPGCDYKEFNNRAINRETGLTYLYTTGGYIIPKKYIIEKDFCKIIKNFE